MPPARRSRRILLVVAAGLLACLATVVLVRRAAVESAAKTMLRSAGAEDVRLSVTAATPWRAQFDDVGFEIHANRVAARRVVVEREHWWQPRLSSLRVEGADVKLDPRQWPARTDTGAGAGDLPVDAISVDGSISVQFGDDDAETFAVRFAAKREAPDRWSGEVETQAPGARGRANLVFDPTAPSVAWHDHRTEIDLARTDDWARRTGLTVTGLPKLTGSLVVTGSGLFVDGEWSNRGRVEWLDGTADGRPALLVAEVDQSPGNVDVKVERAEFEVGAWVEFVRRFDLLPAGISELGGILAFSGELAYREGVFGGVGDARWREGRLVMTDPAFTAAGIAAEFRFDDLAELHTQPGRLRVASVTFGPITATNVAAELGLRGTSEIVVSRASAVALGGTVTTEPFTFFPGRAQFEATLLLERIAIEQVLALADKVPARAVGRVNGRVPLRFADDGFFFGTGWLELTPGTYAEVELEAEGLLTGGVATTSPSYPTLHKIESGLLRLQLSQLRLDIRSPDAPPGRTASIKLVGGPVDPQVKAPVNLNVNVNGPVEQLLNLGMDSRIRFGGTR